MKLRTTSNSIRLRLSQSDVKIFSTNGIVEEEIRFDSGGKQCFFYLLKRDHESKYVTANFENNCLTVLMPDAIADEWISTDLVGMSNVAESADLSILIEKDFTCLVPREDDHDTFPHPLAATR